MVIYRNVLLQQYLEEISNIPKWRFLKLLNAHCPVFSQSHPVETLENNLLTVDNMQTYMLSILWNVYNDGTLKLM